MPSWLSRSKEEEHKEDNKEGEIELKPSEVKAKLDKIDGLDTRFASFETESKKTNERMNSFLDEQEAAKRRRAAEEAAKKATEQSTELSEEFITDPEKAMRKLQDPLVRAQLATASRLLRKEVFDENPDQFKYYTGDFKKRVDAYIDSLNLSAQNDPQSLRNCYNTVAGEHMAEIAEGKLKTRFSAMSTASASGGTKDAEKEVVLSDLEKKAAKSFGITEAEYAKSKLEMNYV